MKKIISIFILIAGCAVLAAAQSERGKSELSLSGGKASVDYGRPAIKGRTIEALPVGSEWRMGANDATTLTTDVDLKFGDKVVQKGTYVLKAKRADEKSWLLVIQSEDGATKTEVPLTFARVEPAVELLTIDLKKNGNGGRFFLQWGVFTLSTDFKKA